MDDNGLTELFRRAADELDVDDRPPIDAILAGRRRVRIRRGLVTVAAVLAVVLVGIAVGTSLSSRSASDRIRTIDGGPRAGTGVPTSLADPPTSKSSVSTTVPPIDTDDPIGELTDRLDSGYLTPVATGTSGGVPWALYLLDARTSDGVVECTLMKVGSPGNGGGASCGKVGIASATRGPVALDGAWSATESDRGIAFAVVPESGRYAWSESDPLTATLLAPGTALPAGSDLVVSQTISTPYGTRVIVVHDYPDDGREPR
jgi:hypothetical protein